MIPTLNKNYFTSLKYFSLIIRANEPIGRMCNNKSERTRYHFHTSIEYGVP